MSASTASKKTKTVKKTSPKEAPEKVKKTKAPAKSSAKPTKTKQLEPEVVETISPDESTATQDVQEIPTLAEFSSAEDQQQHAMPAAMRADFDKLLAKAISRGYITQEEVLEAIIEPELYVADLDDFYDQIVKNAIDIFESVSEDNKDEEPTEVQRELDLINTTTVF